MPSPSECVAPFGRIAVIGLGLIGGSLLQALARTGHSVIGADTDAPTVAAARESGLDAVPDAAQAAQGADLVVIAVPLPDVPAVLRAVAGRLSPHAVLTDVGTLKAPVHRLVGELAPDALFVGGHPLAGTEESGWAAADPAMFAGAPWTLTIEPDTDLRSWLRIAALLCGLGARPVPTSAADQDAAIARVIGLPHVLAEVLALTGLAGGPLGLSIAAGSYTSGSRVARTRPELVATWCDGNPGLLGALDDAISRLADARERFAADGTVLPLATAGNAARLGWEHRAFEQVAVPADRAGLLDHGARGGWITSVTPCSAHPPGPEHPPGAAERSDPAQGGDTPGPAQGADTPGPAQGTDTPGPAQGTDSPGPEGGADCSAVTLLGQRPLGF
ncbi:MAG: prephenate dehydrogenase/arogenate dehydrogenase family protein [Frankiaceae bacterium]|nr:prephenate dehydrogenase/arogenate dehydrogenase family protein [Frankiaceae bacterium]